MSNWIVYAVIQHFVIQAILNYQHIVQIVVNIISSHLPQNWKNCQINLIKCPRLHF